MFVPDMPNVPPQDVPVMIAQANQAQAGIASNERKLGICEPIDNSPGVIPNGGNVFVPTVQAGIYSYLYEHQEIDRSAYATATASVLQNPKHGVLRLVTEADRGTLFSKSSGPLNPAIEAYAYIPEQDYLGNDSVTMLVDIGGKRIKEVYYFKVVAHPVGNDGDREICKKGPFWKISFTLNANGNSTLTSVEYQSPTTDTTTLAATLSSSVSSLFGTSGVTLNIADLAGGALGQTTGSNITLDTAAGNNWFIDTTPSDNSESLPASNPNEWVAKAGSADGTTSHSTKLANDSHINVSDVRLSGLTQLHNDTATMLEDCTLAFNPYA